jgi:hypothetical protein
MRLLDKTHIPELRRLMPEYADLFASVYFTCEDFAAYGTETSEGLCDVFGVYEDKLERVLYIRKSLAASKAWPKALKEIVSLYAGKGVYRLLAVTQMQPPVDAFSKAIGTWYCGASEYQVMAGQLPTYTKHSELLFGNKPAVIDLWVSSFSLYQRYRNATTFNV